MSGNRFSKSIKCLEMASEETPNVADTPLPFMAVLEPSKTSMTDFLSSIQPKQRRGKYITFYLSYEVIEAIEKLSKKRKISKSKIVDKALKQVLFN